MLILVYCLIIVCSLSLNVQAQNESYITSDCIYSVYNTPPEENTQNRVWVTLSAPYDFFQFTKSDTGYITSFTIDLTFDNNETSIQNLISDFAEIYTSSYQQSISKRLYWTKSFLFHVDPGSYTFMLYIKGQIKSMEYRKEETIDIQPFLGQTAVLSEPIFHQGNKQHISSNTHLLPSSSSLSIHGKTSLNISVASYQADLHQPGSVSWTIHPLHQPERVLHTDTLIRATDRNVQFHTHNLKVSDLPSGRYNYSCTLSAAEETVHSSADFSILWSAYPDSLRIAADYLPVMSYILPPDTWSLWEQSTISERDSLYTAWWHDHDPTPNTAANELRNEFFTRIDEVNVEFSDQRTIGWKMDRGRIWILYGPPSERRIRDKEFNTPPYEVWVYDHIDKRFTFLDRNREGRFVLVAENEN